MASFVFNRQEFKLNAASQSEMFSERSGLESKRGILEAVVVQVFEIPTHSATSIKQSRHTYNSQVKLT